MRYAYEVLLNVSFNHTYFANKVFEGLVVEPTSSTLLLFKNYGLLFRSNPGGFQIIFDSNFNGNKRSREDLLSAKLDCRFNVKLNDPNFYNYTAIDCEDISNKVFYFYNTTVNETILKSSVHTSEFVSEYDMKPIADLNESYFVKPFAILDLRLSTGLPEIYSLNFKARETIWRYILINKDLQTLNSPAILDNSGNEPFEGPELLEIDGADGMAFKSRHAISLAENSVLNFQLVENYDALSGRYKVVMRSLPKANPEMITLIKSRNKLENNNYSEIFIN